MKAPLFKGRATVGQGALLLALALGGLAATPEEIPGPAGTDLPARGEYVRFKMIPDRNIFNASRARGVSTAGGAARNPSRVDRLTLVGTMSYEKGRYAFFDGSASEFKQVLETGKPIAGFTITEITGRGVKLEAGAEALELSVGMQLRREEEGDWQVVESGKIQANAALGSNSSVGEEHDSTAEESDIIKRMMQQREQELK